MYQMRCTPALSDEYDGSICVAAAMCTVTAITSQYRNLLLLLSQRVILYCQCVGLVCTRVVPKVSGHTG